MKKYAKQLISVGIALVLCVLGAVWYTTTYNDGRLVKPTDFSAFALTLKDLPMLLALVAVGLYALFLVSLLVYTVIKAYTTPDTSTRTRKLNPKLGLMGFLGFLGLIGFYSYGVDKTIAPFTFFVFFGFFGFFYEGKMSGTFKDERFRENAKKAQLVAFKTGFVIMWLALLLLGRGTRYFSNLEYVAIAYTIVLSLTMAVTMAVTMFLCEYLLYRYDHDEQAEE